MVAVHYGTNYVPNAPYVRVRFGENPKDFEPCLRVHKWPKALGSKGMDNTFNKNKIKIAYIIYVIGVVFSFTLFLGSVFSDYITMGFVATSLVFGLVLRPTLSGKYANTVFGISYVWLIVIFALSIAKMVRPHVTV